MGSIYLLDMPEALMDFGLKKEELYLEPGWQTRSRSTGGFEKVLACGIHHDAISNSVPFQNRINSAIGKTWRNPNAPVGNGLVHFDRIGWYCAGASNTQGRSLQSFITSKGIIPVSQGNKYVCSWEASNPGDGTPWPENQLRLYDIAMAATEQLCGLNFNHPNDLITHATYAPNRKIDPFGPARNYGPRIWEVKRVVAAVQEFKKGLTKSGDGSMKLDSRRLVDSRVNTVSRFPGPNNVGHLIPISPSIPNGYKIAWVTVQINSPYSSGWAKLLTNLEAITTSDLGWESGQQNNNTLPVGLDVNGNFWLYISRDVNFIIDLIGYQQ